MIWNHFKMLVCSLRRSHCLSCLALSLGLIARDATRRLSESICLNLSELGTLRVYTLIYIWGPGLPRASGCQLRCINIAMQIKLAFGSSNSQYCPTFPAFPMTYEKACILNIWTSHHGMPIGPSWAHGGPKGPIALRTLARCGPFV